MSRRGNEGRGEELGERGVSGKARGENAAEPPRNLETDIRSGVFSLHL